MKFDDAPEVLTVKEAAELLRTSEYVIRKLIRTGAIRARKLGRGYKIPKKPLQSWWEQCRTES